MTHSDRPIAAVSAAILLLVLLVHTSLAQDPLKVAPHIFRLLFENNRVRVMQEWLRPGEKEPRHSHPKVVIYAINSYKGKSTSLDGRVTPLEAMAGQVSWSEPDSHALENTGKTILRTVIVELKTSANLAQGMHGGGADLLRVASRTHKLLLENSFVRVLEFHLLPGQRTRTFYQGDCVSYVLTGGILKETLSNRKVVRQVFRPRQARWFGAGSHALENVGLTEVRLFIVELKNATDK